MSKHSQRPRDVFNLIDTLRRDCRRHREDSDRFRGELTNARRDLRDARERTEKIKKELEGVVEVE